MTIIRAVAGITMACCAVALLPRVAERSPGLAVGVMLATSLLHALPDALGSTVGPRGLFATLLAGLLLFFILEKCAAICSSARHHDMCDAAEASTACAGRRQTGWAVLAGDSIHNFTDGIMMAGACLAEPRLGVMTAFALTAHELPKTIGNIVVLLDAGYSKARAYLISSLSSMTAVGGAGLGWLALDRAGRLLPYALAFASSGFIYIAVRHLMPALQRKATWAESVPQVALIAAGVCLVAFTAH
jgi:zinc and cadmium transporter